MVPLEVMSSPPKKLPGDVLCKNCRVPLKGEKISSHAHKTGSWYLLGVLFKIFNEHFCSFYMGFPSPQGPRAQLAFSYNLIHSF